MSEVGRSKAIGRRYEFVILLLLTFSYAILFAFVFRQYAYAEPGGFPVFYTAGKLARFDFHGLYDRHLQDVFHPANAAVGYFFHLPIELILLVPLSYLPQVPAYGCWVFLNLSCLLGVSVVLRRQFPSLSLLVPFAFAPTLSLLLNGQDIGILALLLALSFDRFAMRKDFQAGVLMAIGLFKFPLVIPLAAILGIRHWRVLTGFLACGVPILALSAMALGKQGILDYLALTRGTDAKEDPAILVNLRGVVGEVFGPHPALIIAISLVCVVLAGSLRSTRVQTFCIAIIATVLVSWHAHLYDALLLVIPMAWMYESDSTWMRQTPLFLIFLTLIILPNSAHGYWVGIVLSILFGLLLSATNVVQPRLGSWIVGRRLTSD